jgi:2,3-bisphosphoglycerate-dependent phosphoglycerate mutase
VSTGDESASHPRAPQLLLLLIRHAEQASMLVRDADLSDRGRRQAERLAARLAHLPLTAVVASSMQRALATAQAVAARHGLEVEVEPDLVEVRINETTRAQRYARRSADRRLDSGPDGYARAAMADVRMVPRVVWGNDGGETGAALRARVVPAVERVIARHHGGVVACVVHGGVLNAVLGEWAGVRRDMWFLPWHTGVSSVLVDGGERLLLGVNDASHLAGEEDMLGMVAAHVRESVTG